MKIYIANKIFPEGISFWSIFWRKALSRSGEYCGRISGINFSEGSIVGINLLYGTKKIWLGLDCLQTLEVSGKKSALILNLDPVYLMEGKRVYDSDGRKLGRVIRVVQKGPHNDFDFILVKKGLFSKPISIKKESVQVMKKNIILKDSISV